VRVTGFACGAGAVFAGVARPVTAAGACAAGAVSVAVAVGAVAAGWLWLAAPSVPMIVKNEVTLSPASTIRLAL
jgi:hypothetical protein